MPLVIETVRIGLRGEHPLADAIRDYGINSAARDTGILKQNLIWFLNGNYEETDTRKSGLALAELQAVAAIVGFKIDMKFKIRRLTEAELERYDRKKKRRPENIA